MPEQDYGTYPELSSSFENVRSMYPHSGGRNSPQVPTSGDFAAQLRMQQALDMSTGHRSRMLSMINSTEAGINSMTGFSRNLMLANFGMTQALPFAMTTLGISSPGINRVLGQGIPGAAARASSYLATQAGGMSSSLLGRAGAMGLRVGAGSMATLGRLATLNPLTIGLTVGQMAGEFAAGRIRSNLQATQDIQDSLAGFNMYGTGLNSGTGPGLSYTAASKISKIFKANTRDIARGRSGFGEGELNSLMQYGTEAGLLEGHTGSANQAADRILSLAKVAKEITKLGSGITMKDAMDLQVMASKMGVDSNQLLKGGVVKNIINAAKVSGKSVSEVIQRSEEAGAQYMTMGFGARAGFNLRSYGTNVASLMVGSGALNDEQLTRVGGTSGLENAVFRAGTIALENNSQTLAMASMKIRGGRAVLDQDIIDQYHAGRLSIKDMEILARKNIARLQDPNISPRVQRQLLGQIERGMPDIVKNLTGQMTPEKQMLLAGESILYNAKKEGGIAEAMDAYFGEDKQAREAFEHYVNNYKIIEKQKAKQDRDADILSYKEALEASGGGGKFSRGVEHISEGLTLAGDTLADVTGLTYLGEKSDKIEQLEAETLSGYYGGKKENSILSMAHNAEERASAGISSKTMRLLTSNDSQSKKLLESLTKNYNPSAYNSTSMHDQIKTIIDNNIKGSIASRTDIEDNLREKGIFNIEKGQDTGLISGDLNQDIIDKMTGDFLYGSTTNSLANFFTSQKGVKEQAFTTMGNLAQLKLASTDSGLSARLAREYTESAYSVTGEGRTKYTAINRLNSTLDSVLGNFDNTWFKAHQDPNDLIREVKNTPGVKSNLSDMEIHSLIAARLKHHVKSGAKEGPEGNLARNAAKYMEVVDAAANSLNIPSLNTAQDSLDNISGIQDELLAFSSNLKIQLNNGESGDSGLTDGALAIALGNAFSQKHGDRSLEDDVVAVMTQLENQKIKGNTLDAKSRKNLRALLEKVRKSPGDRAKYGEALIGLGRGLEISPGVTIETSVNANQVRKEIESSKQNLTQYSQQEIRDLGNIFDFTAEGKDKANLLKKYLNNKGITLESLIGKGGEAYLSKDKITSIQAELHDINKASGDDKKKKLEKLLQNLSLDFMKSKPGKEKGIEALPGVIEQLSSGLKDFNTHMQSIASGLTTSADKQTTIVIKGG